MLIEKKIKEKNIKFTKQAIHDRVLPLILGKPKRMKHAINREY